MSRPWIAWADTASKGLAAVSAATAIWGCAHIVVLHDPLNAAEHNDLGVAYEAQGDARLAAREYRRALRMDPRMARARVNLGNLSAQAGRWSEAEGLYRRALVDSPEDPDAMNNLAVALARQHKRLDEAESLARRGPAPPRRRGAGDPAPPAGDHPRPRLAAPAREP